MKKIAISPTNDPWETYMDVEKYGEMKLTNIEFTTTYLCNMRCEHCAVGYTLQTENPNALPLDLLLRRLEEIPELHSLSITGGEPMLSTSSIRDYVLPLLKYASDRGIQTQLNSNLTVGLDRYEEIAPYLDVLHISHNWGTVDDFVTGAFAHMEKKPTYEQREKLFQHMVDHSARLTDMGVFVSAETMLNKRTFPHLEQIHKQVVQEMKCARHEIHPMYSSDFASNLETLSLDEIRTAIYHLLKIRDKNIWMLFGTLPFYPCGDLEEDLKLLRELYKSENVTVRNDPDGRSRLNINIFTGDIIVTDFGDEPSLGNIQDMPLITAYENWLQRPLAKELSCHCKAVKCLGPNVLVKQVYYPTVDFTKKSSRL